ncbi:MAG: CHAP domain-containing protein [Chloroflexota bacterium]|nr:CHAP domain-containing protein [Chloroflexota bacterium]
MPNFSTIWPSFSKIKTFSLMTIFLIGLLSATSFQILLHARSALAVSDTYPSQWAPPVAQDSLYDTWRELNRECTSYAAWMLHSVNGFEMPFFANASDWGTKAAGAPYNYPVNMTPANGSIYWTSSPQHVAWVLSVSSDGKTVTLEDYNHANTGVWDSYSVATSSAAGYIHFKDTQINTQKITPASISFNNALNVFTVGSDGQVYQNYWNGSSWSGFSGLVLQPHLQGEK